MAYVKIEDTFFRHPKVLRVGKDAKLLAVAGICYCGNQLTDGFIPTGAALVIAAETGVTKPAAAIHELVDAGLWDTVEGGYGLEFELFRGRCDDRERVPPPGWRVTRARIFQRDDYTCRYCGQRGGRLECDHVLPVSRGGSDRDDNLVTACFVCNRSKRDMLVQEWVR